MSEAGKLVGSSHGVDYRHDFRTCKQCHEPFPLTKSYFPEFEKAETGKMYFRHICQWCYSVNREKYRPTVQKKAEQDKRYRDANKDKLNLHRRVARRVRALRRGGLL